MRFRPRDVIENPVTGERGVVRTAPGPGNGHLLVADLHVRPGGAVAGEHVHPAMTEAFTVVEGRLGVRLDGRESVAEPGRRIVVPPGVAHDWWNAGDEPAWVVVETRPGERFEEMIRHLFTLAQEGRTDASGRPHLLEAALLAREFDDVLRFTSPPRAVQRAVFGLLAPIARLRGLRGYDPAVMERVPATVDVLPPLPDHAHLGVVDQAGTALH